MSNTDEPTLSAATAILLRRASHCFDAPFNWFWRKKNSAFYTFVYLRAAAPLPRDTYPDSPQLSFIAKNMRTLRADTLSQALHTTEGEKEKEIFVFTANLDKMLAEVRSFTELCELPKLDFHPIEIGFAKTYGDAELLKQLDLASDEGEYGQLLHFFVEEKSLGEAWIDYSTKMEASLFIQWIEQNDDWSKRAGATPCF